MRPESERNKKRESSVETGCGRKGLNMGEEGRKWERRVESGRGG